MNKTLSVVWQQHTALMCFWMYTLETCKNTVLKTVDKILYLP